MDRTTPAAVSGYQTSKSGRGSTIPRSPRHGATSATRRPDAHPRSKRVGLRFWGSGPRSNSTSKTAASMSSPGFSISAHGGGSACGFWGSSRHPRHGFTAVCRRPNRKGNMALPDLRSFFDPTIHLPIGGKDYAIPAAQIDQARRLRHSCVHGMSEVDELAEIAELFGPELTEQMCADGVLWTEYLHIGRTALLWIGTNADIAEAHWKLAQLGERTDLDKVTALIAENQRRRSEAPAADKPAADKPAPKKRAPRRRGTAKAKA